MFGVSSSLPLAQYGSVILPLPLSRPPIERTQGNGPSSQFKNFLKIASTFMENSDKIILTEKQIGEFDILGRF